MEKFAIEDEVDWGLTHGFFAMMGGFCVVSKVSPEDTVSRRSRHASERSLKVLDDGVDPEPDYNPGERIDVDGSTESHPEEASRPNSISVAPPLRGHSNSDPESNSDSNSYSETSDEG